MKRLVYLSALCLFSGAAYAQDNNYESLARTFSQTGPQGTARMQAMGGNHTAIGADISNINGNPAGLGFYTRSELSISPLFNQINNSSEYINRTQNASTNQFSLGNLGVVFAGNNRKNPVYTGGWQGGAFGASYSRQNIFKSSVRFGGINEGSSMSDFFAQTANTEQSGGTPVQEFKDDLYENRTVFNYPTSMYYYGLVMDPGSSNGPPYRGVEPSSYADQLFNSTTTGHTSSWNFAYGANYMNKLYVGVGFSLARLNYTNTKTMDELFVDANGVPNGAALNGFAYTNELTTSGRGFNLSGGLVYRPNDLIRLGLSVTSPTWYTITESASQSLQTTLARNYELSASTFPDFSNDLPNQLRVSGYGITTQNGVNYITSVPTLSVYPFDTQYRLRTPTKLSGGLGLFFGKNGFLSADAEFVNYTGMKLSSDDPNAESGLADGYYTNLVKNTYRNVVNLKVGGEYRMNQVSLRAGVSYYQDPYKQTAQFTSLDRSRMVYSGGIGFKSERFYIDATALYSQQTTAYSPYILANTANYASAKIKNQVTSGVLTIGTYF